MSDLNREDFLKEIQQAQNCLEMFMKMVKKDPEVGIEVWAAVCTTFLAITAKKMNVNYRYFLKNIKKTYDSLEENP
jgi:hypothetical protein